MKKWILFLCVNICLSTLPIFSQQKVITHYHYWFDKTREGETLAPYASSDTLNLRLSTTGLSTGLHTLYFRFKDSDDAWSPVHSWMFYRGELRDTTLVNGTKMVEYWYDNDRTSINQIVSPGDTVSFVSDASSLSEGLHTLHYRVQDMLNRYSPIYSWLFYRGELRDTTLVNGTKMVEYWYDNDRTNINQIVSPGDTVSFVSDASSLSEGLHTFHYRVQDMLNRYSPVYSWLFYKGKNRASKITWYKYWWNDHIDKAVTCNVVNDSSVFVLDKYITLPDYAQNDGYSTNSIARFHIIFGDDAGNMSSVEWQDISYPDVIPPISSIQANATQVVDNVVLTWNANEDSVRCFNIYYAENDQPFVLWLPNTTLRTANFNGQKGMYYRFTVTAQDIAGNREELDESKYISVYFSDNE